MKNKILLLTATHGDEAFSIPVVKKLSKTFKFDWLISNQKAYELKKRFFERDLNRSGPGNPNSKLYERRRAFELIKLASQYDYVIDIHGTIADTGLFVILSDPNWRNIEFAKQINLKNVVLWPSLKPTGPLTQFIPNSLEIECGSKNSPLVAKKLKTVLFEFLSGVKSKQPKQYYIVSGQFRSKTKLELKDFTPTRYKNQTIIPLMPGQYQQNSCYLLQKLNDTL
jgi:hypothetical protein